MPGDETPLIDVTKRLLNAVKAPVGCVKVTQRLTSSGMVLVVKQLYGIVLIFRPSEFDGFTIIYE